MQAYPEFTRVILGELAAAEHQLRPLEAVHRPARSMARALRRCQTYIVRPLRLAIFGEFNTGKSSLANLLLGRNAMPTAAIALTRRPTRTYFAEAPSITVYDSHGRPSKLDAGSSAGRTDITRIDVALPASELADAEIWDMPHASDADSVKAAIRLMDGRPDIAIWCTSATQAWKESERETWDQLPARLHTNSLLAVTFADLLASEADRQAVLRRVGELAGAHFNEVVMLSSLPRDETLEAGSGALGALWDGQGQLETSLRRAKTQALTDRARRAGALLARRSSRELALLERV